MLDAERMTAFRAALRVDGGIDRFAGLPCRQALLAPGKPPVPVWTEDPILYAPTPPAALFGTPVDPTCLIGLDRKRIELPSRHFLRLENAAVIGASAVLTRDGALFAPDPVTALPDAPDRYDYHGFALTSAATGTRPPAVHFFGRPTPRVVAADALFLTNLEPGNYGSFLFRQLPQLIAAKRLGQAWDCYITPERTSFLREAIALLELPRRPIYTVAEVGGDVFRSVLLASGVDQEGILSAATLEGLRLLRRRAGRIAGSSRETRLYVSRQLTGIARPDYRPLVNETEIQALAEARGFVPCWPESLSFAEQIRLFSGARLIAGPSGSGMLNAVFALVGSRVLDMESYQVTVRQHANLYSSSGKRYAFAFGTLENAVDGSSAHSAVHPAARAWRLDPAVMEQGLAWLSGKMI